MTAPPPAELRKMATSLRESMQVEPTPVDSWPVDGYTTRLRCALCRSIHKHDPDCVFVQAAAMLESVAKMMESSDGVDELDAQLQGMPDHGRYRDLARSLALRLKATEALRREQVSSLLATEKNLAAERDAERERAERAEVDAKRYRWLRAGRGNWHWTLRAVRRTVHEVSGELVGGSEPEVLNNAELDAAIDTALAEEGPKP